MWSQRESEHAFSETTDTEEGSREWLAVTNCVSPDRRVARRREHRSRTFTVGQDAFAGVWGRTSRRARSTRGQPLVVLVGLLVSSLEQPDPLRHEPRDSQQHHERQQAEGPGGVPDGVPPYRKCGGPHVDDENRLALVEARGPAAGGGCARGPASWIGRRAADTPHDRGEGVEDRHADDEQRHHQGDRRDRSS